MSASNPLLALLQQGASSPSASASSPAPHTNASSQPAHSAYYPSPNSAAASNSLLSLLTTGQTATPPPASPLSLAHSGAQQRNPFPSSPPPTPASQAAFSLLGALNNGSIAGTPPSAQLSSTAPPLSSPGIISPPPKASSPQGSSLASNDLLALLNRSAGSLALNTGPPARQDNSSNLPAISVNGECLLDASQFPLSLV